MGLDMKFCVGIIYINNECQMIEMIVTNIIRLSINTYGNPESKIWPHIIARKLRKPLIWILFFNVAKIWQSGLPYP